MDQKKFKLILIIGSAVFAAAGILLLILGLVLDVNTLFRVFAIISAVFSVAIAGEGVCFLLLMKDTKQNYFLFNHQTKRNIPVQKLTFQIVNSRITRYIAGYASSEGKLWTDRVFDDPSLEMDDVRR